MDYTTLSLEQVRTELEEIARDAEAVFGRLNAQQLNWRPDASRWSVAQCFDHLVTIDGLMFRAAEDALNGGQPRTVWQRLPLLPGVIGRMMIRSLSPDATRKFTAPLQATPAASAIPADIVQRFVQHNRDAAAATRKFDERRLATTIMTSPFLRLITYSVLDAWRLVAAHERRHFEQARRVIRVPGFPQTSAQ
jgi:hypothetical protein